MSSNSWKTLGNVSNTNNLNNVGFDSVVSNNIIPSRILGMTFSYILAVIFTGLGIWGNLMSEISSV